jgi:hypothetical protein
METGSRATKPGVAMLLHHRRKRPVGGLGWAVETRALHPSSLGAAPTSVRRGESGNGPFAAPSGLSMGGRAWVQCERGPSAIALGGRSATFERASEFENGWGGTGAAPSSPSEIGGRHRCRPPIKTLAKQGAIMKRVLFAAALARALD